jgi:hypothetical protein
MRFAPGGLAAGYSYGLGYDDWHPGTFSVQMNHWGPVAFVVGDLRANRPRERRAPSSARTTKTFVDTTKTFV